MRFNPEDRGRRYFKSVLSPGEQECSGDNASKYCNRDRLLGRIKPAPGISHSEIYAQGKAIAQCLVWFPATGCPIGRVHADRKQRRRRVVIELDDEREHQTDEVDVLCAEIEAKNAAARI